jgi:Family of unknown function (DUF5681)
MSKRKISKLRVAPKAAPVIGPKLRGRPFRKGNKIGASTRFQAGVSGNPHGRPKTAEIARASRAWLAEEATLVELHRCKLPPEFEGRPHAEVIAFILGQQALQGSLAAAAELADRAEGRPGVFVHLGEEKDALDQLVESMRALGAAAGPPENEIIGDDGIVQ